MKKTIKAKITKKQLQACHIYIFQQLTELALNNWRIAIDMDKNTSIKEKNGTVYFDMKKMSKRK